jgi:hypothetical protein
MTMVCIEDGERYVANFDKALCDLADDQSFNYASGAWWPISDFEDFLSYVVSRGQELSITPTGIRIYFGKYTDDADFTKLTMFITPTFTPDLGEEIPGPNDPDMHTNVLNLGGSGLPPKTGYPRPPKPKT